MIAIIVLLIFLFRPIFYSIVSLEKSKIFVILCFLEKIFFLLYYLYLDFMSHIEELEKKFPLQYGEHNPILRKKSLPVSSFTQETKILAEALRLLMWKHDGVGLAAPQIGKNVRMIAVTQRDMSQKNWELLQEWVMINPLVIGKSKKTTIDEEACLSLPNITGKVERVDSITVKFQTLDGKSHIHKANGYNARIILHEIDHLEGILFTDKIV